MTFAKDGEMISEPGHRRIRDRKIDTLRTLFELAWFITPDTFDADVELDTQDYEKRIFDRREDEETDEVAITDAREFVLLTASRHPERVVELMREEGYGALDQVHVGR